MIQQYWSIIRRWFWLLILAFLAAALTAFSIGRNQATIYETSARLIVGPGIDSPNPGLNDLRTSGQLMRTYAELALTRPNLQSVITELQLPLDFESLSKMVDIVVNETTQILSIRVRGSNAQEAVDIANAVAMMIVRLSPGGAVQANGQARSDIQTQMEEAQQRVDESEVAVAKLDAQWQAATTIEQKNSLAEELTQARTQLADAQRLLASLTELSQNSNTNQVKVIELAVNAKAVDSNLLLITALAGIAGFILALTVVLGLGYFDDTIRTVDDFAFMSDLPILATLAKHKRLSGVGRERLVVHALPESRVVENYRVLSIKLLLSGFQNKGAEGQPANLNLVDPTGTVQAIAAKSTLRSVLISGTQANEDVSEIASNLAVLLAQTGYRVILVDAYLHRPAIHHLFGIQERRGLADILLLRNLAPKATISHLRNLPPTPIGDAAQLIHVPDAELQESAALVNVDWAPGLQLLVSGSQPTNPFELLVSPHMADLIKRLEKQADLVLIAASPLLSSADSLILASRVDGVVIVARAGKTRRETIKEIVASMRSLNANILGAILNHHQSNDTPTRKQRKSVGPLTQPRTQKAQSAVPSQLQSVKL
ncbi:MAG: hypothetical protein R3C14_54825 [Caldilineaceae bacterium]